MNQYIYRPAIALVLGVAVTFLASCQSAPVIPRSLVFESTLFQPEQLTRRADGNAFGRLQFIIARNGPRRAAIVHIEADDLSVISEDYSHSRTFLRTWKEMMGVDLKFGDEYYLRTSVGEIRYERFTSAGIPCFQFYHLFNISDSDDMARERSIVAGYYCNVAGKQSTEDEMSEFLQGVRLNRTDIWDTVPRANTTDLFAPKRRLFKVRIKAADGPRFWDNP